MALAFSLAGAARAQDGAGTSHLAEAEAAFHAGEAAYANGEFDAALAYFRRCYELTHDPDVLYNVATVEDRLRHDEEALEAYRAYLSERPDTPDRAQVEGRITALERAIAEREAARQAAAQEAAERNAAEHSGNDAPLPHVAPVESTSGGDVGPGPYILLGFGGAAAIAAGVLFGLMAADFNTVETASAVPWDPDIRSAWERAPQLSVAGAVTAGVAGVCLVVGIVWLAIGAPEEGEPEVAVGISPRGLEWRARL
ncbi:MAG: tol-pal system YbgF family protein [Sandaracinaceae bacterium]